MDSAIVNNSRYCSRYSCTIYFRASARQAKTHRHKGALPHGLLGTAQKYFLDKTRREGKYFGPITGKRQRVWTNHQERAYALKPMSDEQSAGKGRSKEALGTPAELADFLAVVEKHLLTTERTQKAERAIVNESMQFVRAEGGGGRGGGTQNA